MQASHPYSVFIFLDLFSLLLSPWISPFIQIVKYLIQLYLILLTLITIKGYVFVKHCCCYYGLSYPSHCHPHGGLCVSICTHLYEEHI